MIYLGSLGRMIGVKCPASQNVSSEERYSFRQTLGGVRKAQVRTVGRRSWSVQTSEATTPADANVLAQFANGAWGNGPFYFLSADALVTNALVPAASMCMPGQYILTSGVTVTEAGQMWTPDGWAARSFIKSTNNGLFLGKDMIPVISGSSVTASAYVRGSGGSVGVAWYDSAGALISTAYSSVTAGASNVVRSWLTRTPPANAVSFRIMVNSSTQQTCWPAVTFTADLQPFGEGQGCVKAVVNGLSQSVTMAVAGMTYLSQSYTITEVG